MVQEALLRAWRNAGSCRSAEDPLPWLLTITRREAYRRHSSTREAPVDTNAIDEPVGVESDDVHARLDVEAALEALRPVERQLLELRYHHDLTQPAVAKRLGIPEGTTKVRLHRLRARLRTELEGAL